MRTLFSIALWLGLTAQGFGQVVISEFLADNTSLLRDEDGEFSDWIELHNPTAVTVTLTGWFLTDSPDNLRKWALPESVLGPNEYRVVFASGKNRRVADKPLHTNFGLAAEGEYLALVQPDGRTVASAWSPAYPEQFADVSYGSVAGTAYYFSKPTPGAANAPGFIAPVEAPRFSQSRGFFEEPFALSLAVATPGAKIRYTLDGTTPTQANGLDYVSAIPIDRTTAVKAAAFRSGYRDSRVVTHTFLFTADIIRQAADGAPPPGWPARWGGNTVDYGMDPQVVDEPAYRETIQSDLKTIPSFSIVMNLQDLFDSSTGIYANPGQDGRAWERPTSVELIYPDGRDGFHINAGIRIRGGFSRSTGNPKHAFRLFFREEYGEAKLRFPLFGDRGADRFDALDLRTFQNYSWSFQGDSRGVFIRDLFSRDTQLSMGQPGERGDYYHLYINGIYWGLYNTCERPEASYGATYFGGEPEDYDVIKVEAGPYTINATDGTMAAWNQLYALAKAGLTNNSDYFRLQGRTSDGVRDLTLTNWVDVPNLIDYMLVIVYGGNLDAPISNFLGNTSPNNWYGLRQRNGTEGFRFFAHDAEHTLLSLNENRTGPYASGDSSISKSNPQWLWQKMWPNPEFRMLCADQIHRHFFNHGALTPAAARERFLRRVNEIDRAVVAESARWGDAKSASPLTRTHWLNQVNALLNNYFPRRSDIVLDQLRAKGLYPSVAAPTLTPHGGPVEPNTLLTFTVPRGTLYWTRDGSDPRRLGGEVSASARRDPAPWPLRESVSIKARILDNGVWSALTEAEFTVIQRFQELRITEIMYHPAAAPASDRDPDEFEFIELKNVGATPLDLSGVHFLAGIEFRFPNGTTLAPSEFAVLAADATAFAQRYPGVRLAGTYQGRLGNGGDSLVLAHATGAPITRVTYTDRVPWPPTADAGGFSLVPVDPNSLASAEDPARWRASANAGGSPGADDLALPQTGFAVINEVLAHTDPPQVDAVELFNPSNQEVDVSYWFLSDDRATPKKFRLPPGTRIPAGGYLILTEADFNADPASASGFNLSSHGDEIYLTAADATGRLTGFSDGWRFEASRNGVSFGRFTNQVGQLQFPPQVRPTLGSANAGPAVGPIVLNEVHFYPPNGEEEFIELRNISSGPVALSHARFPELTWRLSGIDFSFPTGVILPRDGLALVVAAEPASFRQRYSVPPTVPIFGPYLGSLQNEGEWLRLEEPDTPDVLSNGSSVVPYLTVDSVRYDRRSPWPEAAAGQGASLERLVPPAHGPDPTQWRASLGGPSPGAENGSNRAPRVRAGPDQAIVAQRFPHITGLTGSAQDDGRPSPPGALSVTWTQIAGPAPVTFSDPHSWSPSVALPGTGAYTLKLTVHDGATAASDEVTLQIERSLAPTTLVRVGSTWKYSDTGTDLATAWRAANYNDASWKSGPAPLGYGDGDEATVVSFGGNASAKHLTTYFRHAFSVAQPKDIKGLLLRVLRDDGAVVYLNGREVFRSNMPEGTIAFDTGASAVVSGADESTSFFEGVVDPALLLAGVNVLAVEVHQENAGSSDLSFDLELSGETDPANQAPSVDAGNEITVVFPSTAVLTGAAFDDGLPLSPGLLTVRWEQVSGPGTAVWTDPTQIRTSVTFSQTGVYVLRLRATDGALAAEDSVMVTVTGETYLAWAARYFTAEERNQPAVGGETGDPDRDGASNGDEFRAGTDPRDPASIFRATVKVLEPNRVAIQFRSAANRGYTVQVRNSLDSGAWTKLADVPAETLGRWVDVIDARPSSGRFYRLVTPIQP